MFLWDFVKAPLVPECYASREKLSRGVKRGREGIERAQGRETRDVERNGEQAMGRKGRTQGKRSMSCEEEGNASRGKEESKTHKRS